MRTEYPRGRRNSVVKHPRERQLRERQKLESGNVNSRSRMCREVSSREAGNTYRKNAHLEVDREAHCEMP